jgi:hypothetical protein
VVYVLSILKAQSEQENWADCPAALTAIRNAIIHPTAKNRKKIAKQPPEAIYETWLLGLWALELCMLRLFNYNGKYCNRITAKCESDREQVPWAAQPKSSNP